MSDDDRRTHAARRRALCESIFGCSDRHCLDAFEASLEILPPRSPQFEASLRDLCTELEAASTPRPMPWPVHDEVRRALGWPASKAEQRARAARKRRATYGWGLPADQLTDEQRAARAARAEDRRYTRKMQSE